MLRKIIIVGALFAAMPTPPEKPGANPGEVAVAPNVNMFSYLAAAASTFTDAQGFCLRNPDVCVTAGYLVGKVEAKAKYSAQLIYDWANEAQEEPQSDLPPLPIDLAELDDVPTGTITPQVVEKPWPGRPHS